MNCHHINSLLSEYADGMLQEPAAAEVKKHLAECDGCRETYESMLIIMDRMSHMEVIPEPPDFLDRVNARLDRRFSLARLWRRLFVPLRFKLPLEAAALAAIALLMVRLWGIGGAPNLFEVTVVAPAEKKEPAQLPAEGSKKGGKPEQPTVEVSGQALKAVPLSQVTDEKAQVKAGRSESEQPVQKDTPFDKDKNATRQWAGQDSEVREEKPELKRLADQATAVRGGRNKPIPPIDLSTEAQVPETNQLQFLKSDSLDKPTDLNSIIQSLGAKLISRTEILDPGGPTTLVIEIQAGKYLELIQKLGQLGEIQKSTSPIPENKLGSIRVKIVLMKSGS